MTSVGKDGDEESESEICLRFCSEKQPSVQAERTLKLKSRVQCVHTASELGFLPEKGRCHRAKSLEWLP